MATVLGYVLEYAAFANLKYRTLWYEVQGDSREKFSGISSVFLVSGRPAPVHQNILNRLRHSSP